MLLPPLAPWVAPVGAAGADWEVAALTQLLGAGFNDGVIVVGDAEPEPAAAPGGWRQQAALMSDAILCHVPPGAGRDDYVTREIMAWAESGKMFCTRKRARGSRSSSRRTASRPPAAWTR